MGQYILQKWKHFTSGGIWAISLEWTYLYLCGRSLVNLIVISILRCNITFFYIMKCLILNVKTSYVSWLLKSHFFNHIKILSFYWFNVMCSVRMSKYNTVKCLKEKKNPPKKQYNNILPPNQIAWKTFL
jgi:hypothetical protein